MASLMLGEAKEGPCKNEELCPIGTPSREADATAPPKARTNSL